MNQNISVDEVPEALLHEIVNRNICRSTCRECGYTGFYKIRGGYNDYYDCKKCGKEDAIKT